MAERTSGLYRLITVPNIYAFFQNLLAGPAARLSFRNKFFSDVKGKRVLEIGCGPGTSYPTLSESGEFIGIDWNPDHIRYAQGKFGSEKARFIQGDVRSELSLENAEFDYVFAFGLLHHLDDKDAHELLAVAYDYLKVGGKFVSVDPVYHDGQHWFARWLCDRDSGQNVRKVEGYEALLPKSFGSVASEVITDGLRVPYSHCIMIATKS